MMTENRILTFEEICEAPIGRVVWVEEQVEFMFPSGLHTKTDEGLEDDVGFVYFLDELRDGYGLADSHGYGVRVWDREPTPADKAAHPWQLKEGCAWPGGRQ